jgi:hypothetical protein
MKSFATAALIVATLVATSAASVSFAAPTLDFYQLSSLSKQINQRATLLRG